MSDSSMTLPSGRSVAYTDLGPADGPVVFYFHGAPSSRLDLQAFGLESRFESLGIRAISPDRPGYGGSSAQPGRTMDQWPADVLALADHLSIDRFAVVGVSSGGPYAVACAALLGARVAGCGVVAGVTDMGWAPAWDNYEEGESRIMRCASLDEAMRVCTEMYGADGEGLLTGGGYEFAEADVALFDDEEVAMGLFATSTESLRQGAMGFAEDIFVQGRPWPFDPNDITARCRVLHGDADRIVPIAHSRHTADVVPGAELVVCPGHGHLSISAEVPSLAADLLGIVA